MKETLKYSNLPLEAVFNNLDASIYITDMNSYEILYMDKHMKALFEKDLTGTICWKSLHKNQKGPCEFCTNDELTDDDGNPTEPHVWEFFNQKLNKWYELHDQAIPWIDDRLVRMEIAIDITARKHLEEELRQARKMESIGTLAGGIAHDFNNLLHLIVGNTELALEYIPEWNPSHSNLKEIESASLRAAGVVKQLLIFSHKTNQDLKPINSVTIIKDALKFIGSTLSGTIKIKTTLPDDDIPILGDPVQINQVMMNLCTNASQAESDLDNSWTRFHDKSGSCLKFHSKIS